MPEFFAPPGVLNLPFAVDASTNPVPATTIAVMYNYYEPSVSDNSVQSGFATSAKNIINLLPFSNKYVVGNCSDISCISQESFKNAFYTTQTGYFNVNPANRSNALTVLSKYFWQSGQGADVPFSLYHYLIHAYSTNKGIDYNDIEPRVLILLQRETNTCRSLADIRGSCVSLSWHEFINSLIENNFIEESTDSADTSVVPVNLVVNFHSYVLDTDLKMNLTYNVVLSGYKTPASIY
jgi:hypothetical protein